MKHSLLSSSDIDAKMEWHIAASKRHIDASMRHTVATGKLLAEIQKRNGTESIESKINRLTEMQQIFVRALLNSPEQQMTLIEIEKIVWNKNEGECVKPDTRRKFLQRLEEDMAKHAIWLLIEPLKHTSGDIWGTKSLNQQRKRRKIEKLLHFGTVGHKKGVPLSRSSKFDLLEYPLVQTITKE